MKITFPNKIYDAFSNTILNGYYTIPNKVNKSGVMILNTEPAGLSNHANIFYLFSTNKKYIKTFEFILWDNNYIHNSKSLKIHNLIKEDGEIINMLENVKSENRLEYFEKNYEDLVLKNLCLPNYNDFIVFKDSINFKAPIKQIISSIYLKLRTDFLNIFESIRNYKFSIFHIVGTLILGFYLITKPSFSFLMLLILLLVLIFILVIRITDFIKIEKKSYKENSWNEFRSFNKNPIIINYTQDFLKRYNKRLNELRK